jgi:ribosome-associated translation inhibitor RaiA
MKHQYELEINHVFRGNSHTSPAAEEDIANLQESYHRDSIHMYKPGRKLSANGKAKDYAALGAESEKLSTAITRWQTKRDTDVSTIQIWEV